jgi:Nucleotide modification associated domain 3
MNSLLIRVGADQSNGGGLWNGPVDLQSGKFVYVPIPETQPVHEGLKKNYNSLSQSLSSFGVTLPPHLQTQAMHLDPDFDYLTYGDRGERAKQIQDKLGPGDLIVFYAALCDVRDKSRLLYAIIGLFVVESIIRAADLPARERDINAHSRRILSTDAQDLIVCARPKVSGRLERCLPIGEWRDRAYRVRHDLLEAWGGLSVKDGYLQRSARLPQFLDPKRFLTWFNCMGQGLLQANN